MNKVRIPPPKEWGKHLLGSRKRRQPTPYILVEEDLHPRFWLGKMSIRLFEGSDHASVYQKYRFPPQKNLRETIFSFLGRKARSFNLAVDLGCGSGQSTPMLATHFQKVVGTDVSASQIEEARRQPHPPNVSYLVCPAEDLPFEDGSVDLLTAFASAHWFDTDCFLQEADRVLKPSGSIVLSTYNQIMRFCYGDCNERLAAIWLELLDELSPYEHEKLQWVVNGYQELFDLLPYPDKERITGIVDNVPMTVANLMGYVQTLNVYQSYRKANREAATSILRNTEQKFLEAMGVSSSETLLEMQATQVCIFCSKGC